MSVGSITAAATASAASLALQQQSGAAIAEAAVVFLVFRVVVTAACQLAPASQHMCGQHMHVLASSKATAFAASSMQRTVYAEAAVAAAVPFILTMACSLALSVQQRPHRTAMTYG